MAATRLRKDKQIDKSTTPHSLVYTNSSNEQTYFLPPLVAGDFVLKWDGTSTDLSWLSTSSLINIYNNDGTIAGPRVVSFDNPLTFQFDDGSLDSSLLLTSDLTYNTNDPGVSSGILSITPVLASIAINNIGADTGSGVNVQPNLTRLYAENNTSGDNVMLDITNQTGVIASTYAGFQGLRYFADYSANFTSLSLITKGYLDGVIATLPTDNIYTADGTLAGTRILTGNGFNLTFAMGSGDYVSNTVLGPDISEIFLQNTLTDDITTQSLSSSGLYQSWENTGSGGSSSYYLDSTGFRFIRLGGVGTQKIEANSSGMIVSDDELDQGMEYEFNHATYFGSNPRSIPDVGYVQSLISAIPSLWTDAGAYTYLTSTTDKLAIGSSTANGKLHIKDNGFTGSYLIEAHVDDQNPYIAGFFNDTYSTTVPVFEYFSYNTGEFRMGTPAATKFSLYTNGYTNPRVVILSDGKVGISTSTPSEALDVNGNIRLRSALYDSSNSAGSSGNVLASTGSATAWSSLSSLSIPSGTGIANQWAYWSGTNALTTSNILLNSSSSLDATNANSIILPSRASTNLNTARALYSRADMGDLLFYRQSNNLYLPLILGRDYVGTQGSWTSKKLNSPELFDIMAPYGMWTTSDSGTTAAGGTFVRTLTLSTSYSPGGVVYPAGEVFLRFWAGNYPQAISVRVQSHSGTWYGPYAVNMTPVTSVDYGVNNGIFMNMYKWNVQGIGNYLRAMEFTFTNLAGASLNIQGISYFPDSAEGVNSPYPFISRSGAFFTDISNAIRYYNGNNLVAIFGPNGGYTIGNNGANGTFAVGTSSILSNTAFTVQNPVADNGSYYVMRARNIAGDEIFNVRGDGTSSFGDLATTNVRLKIVGKGSTGGSTSIAVRNSTNPNYLFQIGDDAGIYLGRLVAGGSTQSVYIGHNGTTNSSSDGTATIKFYSQFASTPFTMGAEGNGYNFWIRQTNGGQGTFGWDFGTISSTLYQRNYTYVTDHYEDIYTGKWLMTYSGTGTGGNYFGIYNTVTSNGGSTLYDTYRISKHTVGYWPLSIEPLVSIFNGNTTGTITAISRYVARINRVGFLGIGTDISTGTTTRGHQGGITVDIPSRSGVATGDGITPINVRTIGSSTTAIFPNNNNSAIPIGIMVGSKITANGVTRTVVDLIDHVSVTLDSPVNWDNGGTGYTFTYTNAFISLQDGANKYFVVDGAGNTGVNTNTPTQRLDVNGAMRLRGDFYDYANSPGNSGDILTSLGAGAGPIWQSLFTLNIPTGAGTPGQIAYYTSTLGLNSETGSGANAFTWDSTNNRLGVRTSSPAAALEVRGDSLGSGQTLTDAILLYNSTPAAAGAQQASPAIRWRGNGWKTNVTAASQPVDFRAFVLPVQGTSAPSGRLYIGSAINGSFSDGQFVFDSSGTLGIGTTAPTSRLHIDNSILTSAYILGIGALTGSTNVRSIDMTRTTGSGSFDYVQTHSGTGDNCIQLIGNTTGDTFIVFTISGPSVSYTQGVDTSDSNIFKFGVGGTTPSTISSTAFSYNGPNNRIGIGGSPHSTQKIYLQGSMKMDVGSDATGDTYYRDSSGNLVRLGIGSSGQVLKVSSGIPSWGTDLNGIYTGSGSLSGATTVTMGTNQLLFSGSSGAGHTLTADLDPSTQIHLKMLDTSGVDPELTELVLTETSVNLGIGNAAIFSTESSYINFAAAGTTWNYGGHEILMDSSGIFITDGNSVGAQYIADYSASILSNERSIPDIYTVRQNAVEGYEIITSTTSPINLTNHIPDYLIAQGSTQATFTFNLPASPVNGRVVKLTFSNNVTALTIGAQGGITILGPAATTASIGTQLEYKYYHSILSWIRIK